MQDCGYGVPRMPLLGNRVNKGKKKVPVPPAQAGALLLCSPASAIVNCQDRTLPDSHG